MQELKRFLNTGMDTDSDLTAVTQEDVIESWNVRYRGTVESEDGIATDIESNELISGAKPAGINKTIGAEGFEDVRKAYAFVYNSAGKNQIVEFDYDTETETVIFENLTMTNGVNILPLDPLYCVCDIKMIQGKYLIFNAGNIQPGIINLDRLKSGGYSVITLEDITLVKGQPITVPTYVYNDDSGRSVNTIKKRLFQFTEQFIRLDDEYSAWSTYSKRNVPESEATPSFGTDVTKANNLIVTVDAGNDRVKTINVGARYDNLDWFLVKSVERKDVLLLPNTLVDVENEIYEAYDPATNTYSFAFYNDGLYNNLPVLETDLPYDYVPKKSGALEVINGSILVLADLTEGYKRPVVDVNINVTNYDPAITVQQPDNSNGLRVVSQNQNRVSGSHKRDVQVNFGGIAHTGDVFVVKVRDIRDYGNNRTYTYTVKLSQNNNTALAVQGLATVVPFSNVSGTQINFRTEDYFELESASINLQNAGTGVSKSIHSIKLNSAYQLALAHYDQNGTYFPVVSDKRFVVKTQSYAQSHGLIPQINWQINSLPPVGATSAQWLISRNNTHETDLYINGALDTDKSDNDYLVFNISSLKKFNDTNSSSVLSYDYSEGDRATFMFTFSGTATPIKWFDAPAIDVEVVGFDIEVDTAVTPNVTKYFLKVRKSSALNLADITATGVLMEIYSPKKRTLTTGDVTTLQTTLFYEIGEQIKITNGDYEQKQGIIKEGDAYFKTREVTGVLNPNVAYTFLVEDFNFSDFYKSNYYSYGRARLYDDVQDEIRKKASIRYSDTFITGSKINGISRFYGERLYGESNGETSSKYGAIVKLSERDSYLVCLQELNDVHIPVNISILEDQAEQQNVAISDRLLNKVRYTKSGVFGIGLAKESFARSQNGTIYFVDPNNSLPVRDGYNGVQPISAKMTKFFRRILQQAKKDGRKIFGFYDNFNDEYNIHIETAAGVLVSFKFNATNWDYLEAYTINPATLALTGVSNGSVAINNTTGQAVFTPNTGYSGNAGFSFSYSSPDGTITKNVCGTVTPGITTIDPFYFTDLTNQPLNTLTASNTILIGGNTIAVPISITGGEYSINGGAWVTSAGTVNAGDTVQVRHTTSGAYATTVNTTLVVSGYSDTFTTTTIAAPVPVTINYNLSRDTSPYVDGNVSFLKNGVFSELITFVGTGTLSGGYLVGDTLTASAFHYATGYRWPDDASLRMVITDADGTVVFDQTGGTVTDDVVFAPEILLVDTLYTVTITTNSNDTSLITPSYDLVNNNTLIDEADLRLGVTDLTTNIEMLSIDMPGFHVPRNGIYNLKDDANLQRIVIPVPEGKDTNIRIQTQSGFDQTFSIYGGYSLDQNVPKSGILITLEDFSNPSIACGVSTGFAGGESYPSEFTVTLGTALGSVVLNFDGQSIPDKFIVIFDGVEVINTGYRGNTYYQAQLNTALADRGLPPETVTAPGTGTASFNKTTATTTAIVRVYAPLSGTGWTCKLNCPV